MILTILVNKIRSFFLIFLNLFRRALCCFRKRRCSYSDSSPLTHVVSNSETENNDTQNWNEWGDLDVPNKQPKTVQDYIELYRKQAINARKPIEEDSNHTEDQMNLFEDMTPKITRQTKIVVGQNSTGDNPTRGSVNRLSLKDDVSLLPSAELEEWEESSGWEGEQLESEAQKVLREKKRMEREEKAWKLQQKRLEKMSRSLGAKVKL